MSVWRNSLADKGNKSTVLETGAGGQALGVERAGFEHVALIEIEPDYCATLKRNRPNWNVINADLHDFDGTPYAGVDLLAGGVPCPPFSIAGKELGADDERDLFPQALRLVREIKPKAVMFENVRGLLSPKFNDYRESILSDLRNAGYKVWTELLNASDYGVPQLRPRVVIVALRDDVEAEFSYPEKTTAENPPTVGSTLVDLMSENGWPVAKEWAENANKIAPTIVGGSTKHGGPDLGPVRARRAWADLGVDGKGVADAAPNELFEGAPRLTARMIARIQGFPDEWDFGKGKTKACRQIGNAFPPPVAEAVARKIARCLI